MSGSETRMAWTPQQEAVLAERAAELLVAAAAGSGKTAVLVERVVRAASGEGGAVVPLDQLVAVTFTNAAAAELRARVHNALAQRLEQAQQQGRGTQLLRDQLEALPRAGIGTIHSLCGQILRRYGHLGGISAQRQLDEPEAQLIRHDLASALLDARLGAPGDPLRDVALAWGGVEGAGPADPSWGGKGLRQPLLALHEFARGLIDPAAWYEKHLALDLDAAEPDFSAPLVAALALEFEAWREQALRADAVLAQQLGAEHPEAQLLTLLARRRAVLEQLTLAAGWDSMAGLLGRLWDKQQDLRYKPSLLEAYRRDLQEDQTWYERLEGAGAELSSQAKAWQELFATPWPLLAARENATRILLRTLWGAMLEFGAQYERYKRERGLRDFADLERGAYSVLCGGVGRDESGAEVFLPGEAALALRAQYRLVLVDEYQDTSPLQDAILDLITPEALAQGRPRLSVGDVKQSIYAFRHAEPELFRSARRRLAQLPAVVGRELKLTGNFRSRPAILHAVNHLFHGLLTEELGGEDYAGNRLEPQLDYAKLYEEHGHAPCGDAPVVLHLLETGADAAAEAGASGNGPDAPDTVSDEAAEDAQYGFIAQRIQAIMAAASPVYDPQAKAVRPVQWSDIAVLLRSARGRVESLKHALDAAGIPYYAPGRSGFYERPEVADALSLLRVIDNPLQDIPLAAVLRGPAVRLEPRQLLQLCAGADPDDPPALWERVQRYCEAGADAGLRGQLAAFRVQLAAWRDAVRREPLHEVLWRLYTETGLLVACAAQRGGEQRLANLYRLHALAQQFAGFERQGAPRFLEFIASNRRAAGDLGEAPLTGGGRNAVRVMTVHQAKGLEFPVVLLPDMQRRFYVQDLGADVLWHRRAGIGGRYYQWPEQSGAAEEQRLRRYDTLGWRGVRAAKLHDLAAEELRLLYVALTRARERLELVAAVHSGWRDKLDRAEPEAANSALDWLGWRFTQELNGLEAGRPVPAGPAGCWELQLHTAQPAGQVGGAQPRAAGEATAALSTAELTARLAWSYPAQGSVELPAKLTVSRLAHRELRLEEDGAATLAEEGGPQPAALAPRPAFLDTAAAVDAAAVGSAAHRLLARLDYARHTAVPAVAALRDELVQRGVLAPEPAARIDCAAVAQAAAGLASLLLAPGVTLHRELPVALLIPAQEAALALGRTGLALEAGETVYVQGVIDLLAVTQDTALVLDFKTDRAGEGQLLQRYTPQLRWYACAVQQLLPHCRVRWALYGLHGAGLLGPYDC